MPSNVTLFKNIALPTTATSGQTSTVGEPSLANNGAEIYYSGNWYAARSVDDATSWAYVSPFTTFPAADGGFCCDQTLIYDPTRNITIWLLQYIKQNNTNTLRVVVKKGKGGGVYDFFHDLKPGDVNSAWAAEWFDYNSAALSNNYLYVTTNSYSGSTNAWQRAVVFRISLDSLAAGSALSYNYFSTTQNGSLRCTLGATDTMYFGSHNNSSQVRVFTWPESSTTVTFNDVNVTAWTGGVYNAPGPDGRNWLSRTDGRITGAFLASGVIGFLWTANTQTGRPQPYVRAVRIDAATKALVSEPDIWSSTFAYAYPDACANTAGGVGVSLFRGGGAIFPTHVVGLWQDPAWLLADTKAGTSGPQDGKWGDYVTCRPHAPDGTTFIASGYTLQGGALPSNIEPRYVHFGLNVPIGPNVAIRTISGNFITVVNNGGLGGPNDASSIIHTDATEIGPWEKFTLVPLDTTNKRFALKTMTGNYLTAVNGGGLGGPNDASSIIHTDATEVGPWESLVLIEQPDGTYAIRTTSGYYLTAVNGGGLGGPNDASSIIHTDATQVGPWETFTFDSL